MQIEETQQRLAALVTVADLPAARSRLGLLENEAASDGLWDDAARGQALLARIADLRSEINEVQVR